MLNINFGTSIKMQEKSGDFNLACFIEYVLYQLTFFLLCSDTDWVKYQNKWKY